jgi:hypothetical protein
MPPAPSSDTTSYEPNRAPASSIGVPRAQGIRPGAVEPKHQLSNH